ncbi:alpha/beta fold hydrolase [Promicromonospora sukumoe]|uniref:alpha/beta fold hydrolase n=1 Tax=Promicromonospora sukumoe TaxID=88382 RepID=UPI0036653520
MTARPRLGAVEFALRDATRPLLVLGPSLGTSVSALWGDVAYLLAGAVRPAEVAAADEGAPAVGGVPAGDSAPGAAGTADTDGADAAGTPGTPGTAGAAGAAGAGGAVGAGAAQGEFDVIGWDLPGHGTAPTPTAAELDGLSIADLARAVLDVVERAQARRGDVGAPFWYAGVSVGGAVGQQLLLDAPGRVLGAALICTATQFGEPAGWAERADLARRAGTPTQVEAAARRWFAPGFLEREPQVALRLLGSLQTADRFGYAAVCRAVGAHDLRGRLNSVAVPVVAIAGSADPATPPEKVEEIADAVPGARLVVLDGTAHLAPAERPQAVAELVRDLVTGRVTA